jgi:hypothetical protein
LVDHENFLLMLMVPAHGVMALQAFVLADGSRPAAILERFHAFVSQLLQLGLQAYKDPGKPPTPAQAMHLRTTRAPNWRARNSRARRLVAQLHTLSARAAASPVHPLQRGKKS